MYNRKGDRQKRKCMRSGETANRSCKESGRPLSKVLDAEDKNSHVRFLSPSKFRLRQLWRLQRPTSPFRPSADPSSTVLFWSLRYCARRFQQYQLSACRSQPCAVFNHASADPRSTILSLSSWSLTRQFRQWQLSACRSQSYADSYHASADPCCSVLFASWWSFARQFQQ